LTLENMDADPAIEMVAFTIKSVNMLTIVYDMNMSSFEWSANKPVQKGIILLTNPATLGGFAVGDIDGDGTQEVLLGDCVNATGSKTYTGNVSIMTQELAAKHKIQNIGGVISIVVANVYGTGMDLIVGVMDTDDGQNRTGKLIVYDGTYNELWHSETIGAATVVATGDVNGDSKVEIIATSNTFYDGSGVVNTTLYVFSSTTHKIIYKADGLHEIALIQFFVVDVDGNGTLDLLFLDWNNNDGEAYIYAYKV
jgi:hypothetical protein